MRPSKRLGTLAALLFVVSVAAAPIQARQDRDFPLFDTHLHYSRDAWASYPPDTAVALMDRAGIDRALVSSTPDEGTLTLLDRLPDRVVPILRPYRTSSDVSTWTRDPSIIPYVEERLAQGGYRGIGELHLNVDEAALPVPRALATLAARDDLFLHAHSDAQAVEQLVRRYPDVKVLWAHAGMSARAATVGRLVEAYPTLWVELALRTDVAPGGRLDPAWEDLFLRYPDRFTIGSDTWIPSRWAALPGNMAEIQVWLRQLPRDVAEQIAYRNAERLFLTPRAEVSAPALVNPAATPPAEWVMRRSRGFPRWRWSS